VLNAKRDTGGTRSDFRVLGPQKINLQQTVLWKMMYSSSLMHANRYRLPVFSHDHAVPGKYDD